MGDQRPVGRREPKPESGDDPGWFTFIAGLLGSIAGGTLGWALALNNSPDKALQLGLVGGFIGMVLAVVPATNRQRPDRTGHETSEPPEQGDRSLLTMITSLRRPQDSAARIPAAGLQIRPVPNRNADPTGHIEGGLEVRVVRRSGIWARIEFGEESQDPIWVKRRELEPIENPAATADPG